jgi:CRP/FNR family transcriptional regulator
VIDLPILQGLSDSGKETVVRRGSTLRFSKGEAIFTAGSPARGLFVILSGRVRVTTFRWDRPHTIHEEVRGGTLGEVPTYAGGGHPATAVAAEPTTCILLTREALAAVLEAEPQWAWTLLRRLGERVRLLVARLDRNTAQAVPGRLAEFLLQRQSLSGTSAFTLGRTQQEVAEDVGTVREVVVRTLARLRKAGVITPAGRGRYRVKNAAVLAAMADAKRP